VSTTARHVLVSGIVQGVGYRAFAERAARELGLTGWVRNLDDGRVEIYVEGAPSKIETFLERCGRGPRSAEVSDVAASACVPRNAVAFTMRPTALEPEDL
jgi:acylphosphatase